jgi:hypothetical protein
MTPSRSTSVIHGGHWSLVVCLAALLLLAACVPAVPTVEQTPPPAGPTATPAITGTATLAPTPATATATGSPLSGLPDWRDWGNYRAALRPDAQPALETLPNPVQYRIDVTFDPDEQQLVGQQWIHYTNPGTEPLTALPLRLYPNLRTAPPNVTVSDVTVDGTAVATELAAEDTAVLVPLDPPLAPGASTDIYLEFTANVPAGAGGNYGTYSFNEEVLALAQFYPTVPAYGSAGWELEVPSPMGDVTTADAGLYEVFFTAPSDMLVASTGTVIDTTPNPNDTTTWHLASGPAREFNIVASARYVKSSQQVGDMTVNSYYLPSMTEGGEKALDWSVAALETFEEQFGPYPYNELDVVATPNEALGVEYPGLIALASRIYADQDTFFEFATAHEVAHQWWYNEVGNDQLQEPWLDEALAQYSTMLYYAEQYGPRGREGARQSFIERWDRVRSENDQPVGLPVDAYADRAYGAIVYGKGPLFLDALRAEIGDETFAQLLRGYLTTFRWDTARGEDFLALAEKACNCQLDDLYAEWVTGE